MNVTLVYPPNRNIPAAPYGALPLLAGCLGEAGHQVGIVDANLEVFERLLAPELAALAEGYYEAAWRELHPRTHVTLTQMRRLQALGHLGLVPFERLRQGQRAGEILRDRELFRDPANVNWAYDTIANVLRVMYALNPLFYGERPSFLDDLFGHLERDFDNPIRQLVERAVMPQVLAQQPGVVGVCIPFNEQLVEAFCFLKELRRRAPDVKIVVGGAIVTAYHEKLCADPRFYRFADFAMPGEADLSLPRLLAALERGSDLAEVPNLWWRDGSGAIHPPARRELPNLDEIARPDFRRIPVGRYFLPEPLATYQTSRGCYYGKCTFCSFDIKQNFRFRRPELVLEDLRAIQEQGGVRHFMLWDPLTPPRLLKAIASWNRGRPEPERIFWGAETKFEKVFADRAFTDLLYEGGARFLQFGFESGSQRVLDLMRKGNDLEQMRSMLGVLRESRIAVSVQWFIGFPRETEAEAVASFRYLDEHREAILLSSYMGKFTLSPDDDIFRSRGDLYDVDIFQHPDGRYDFRYRGTGEDHYDREELHAAYLARGDAESVTRMAFFVYLTGQPQRARELSGFVRGGALPERWEDLRGTTPVRPEANFLSTYDFDIFTPAEEQGVGEQDTPRPRRDCHVVFVTQTQFCYPVSAQERRLLELADGTRTIEELMHAAGGPTREQQERLLRFVRLGILVVPRLATPTAATA